MNNQIHLAVFNGDHKAVHKLLTAGVLVDARDACSNTPLHYATDAGTLMLELLIGAGADPRAINDSAQTPLDIMGVEMIERVMTLVAQLKEERLNGVFAIVEEQKTLKRRF